MAIEWKAIDPDNPPEGNVLFFYDGKIWDGWTIDEKDDWGYPMWEANEGGVRKAFGVRWYAERNEPPDPQEHF